MKYLNIQDCIEIHKIVIGYELPTTNRIGYLESVLDNIQNDICYPTIADKATHLFFSICKLHPFIDGNKRATIAITNTFLGENNIKINLMSIKWAKIVIKVAENIISKEALLEIIQKDIERAIKR